MLLLKVFHDHLCVSRPPAKQGTTFKRLANQNMGERNWSFFSSNMHIFNRTFPQRRRKPSLHSDEEDDVVGHHDLVVVLHAAQGAADLGLGEAALAALVDVVHQGRHLH